MTDCTFERTTPRLKTATRAAFRKVLRWCSRWRSRRHNIYRFNHESNPPTHVSGLTCERIDSVDALTAQLSQELTAAFGEHAAAMDQMELKDKATLWLGRLDGILVAALCHRNGRGFRQWFLPLDDDDIVLFRVRTHKSFRGRGICPAMYRLVISQTLGSESNAYVDCSVSNVPSIRSITKAGFVRIGTMKAISREHAIYQQV